MNTKCWHPRHGNGRIIGGICQGNYPPHSVVLRGKKSLSPHTCNPATAFVRVVEKIKSHIEYEEMKKEFIQKICPDCGKIISEVEVVKE